MFLEKIVLNNFRQFYGEQTIVISNDPSKNVTLIHAENSVGKTTLLNAILWCFYKDTTGRFEDPLKIVSNQALSEGDFEAKVEVYFSHEGVSYLISREINQNYDTEDFTAHRVDDFGNFTQIPNPIGFVKSVIPQEMSKYFFFDGEYAETFSSSNNKAAVKLALEAMLGCNTAIQALDDMKAVKRSLEKKISALAQYNNTSKMFQNEIEKLEEKINDDEEMFLLKSEKIESQKRMRSNIIGSLRGTDGAKEIQKRRDELESLKKKAVERKIENQLWTTQWIYDSSIGLFATRALEKHALVAHDADIKGLMPSDIAETFVNDILEKKECICCRSFDENSREQDAIESLLKKAGSKVMNDRFVAINRRVGFLTKPVEVALGKFHELKNQQNSIAAEIHEYEVEINECRERLKGSEINEIIEKEGALEKCDSEIENFAKEIGRLELNIKKNNENLDSKKQQLERSMSKDGRAQGVQKQISLLSRTIDKLENELSKYREDSRKIITKKINNILEKTARRDYTAEIDENFNLFMFYGNTKNSVAKSGGENQLLSLAFISSLVDFASDRREETNALLKPGTMAPLMLDSPFGQLDPTYRNETAKFIPRLCNQVILLLSKSQGDKDVINILESRIGAEYVLILENIAQREGKPLDTINRRGKIIDCTVYGADKDKTVIHRIL